MDALWRWLRRQPTWFVIPAGIMVVAIVAGGIGIAVSSKRQSGSGTAGSAAAADTTTTPGGSSPSASISGISVAQGEEVSSTTVPSGGSSSSTTTTQAQVTTSTTVIPSTSSTTTTLGTITTTSTTTATDPYHVHTTIRPQYEMPADGEQAIRVTVYRQSAGETGGVVEVPSGTVTVQRDGTTVCVVSLKTDESANGSGTCTYAYDGNRPYTFIYSGDYYYDAFTYQDNTNTYVYN